MVVVITDAELPGDQAGDQLLGPQMSVESAFARQLHQHLGQVIFLFRRRREGRPACLRASSPSRPRA